jgi:hypothetical protein
MMRHAAGRREPRAGRAVVTWVRRLVDTSLSIGAYSEESPTEQARRRMIVAADWVASLLTTLTIVSEFRSRLYWVWWFAASVASVVYAAAIQGRSDPLYGPRPTSTAAFNLIATGVFTFVVFVCFVRQRDRF